MDEKYFLGNSNKNFLYINKTSIIISCIVIVILASAVLYNLFFFSKNKSQSEKIGDIDNSNIIITSSTESSMLTVDISGSVYNPGVYKLKEGSRVEDAIILAGGFTDKASNLLIEKNINRAMVLKDESKIYIPNINDEDEMSHNSITSYNIYNSSKFTKSVVSINNSSNLELEMLPGIGPVTAQKIISNRPYSSLNQLIEKKIIGPTMFEKIKDSLTL